MRRLLRVGVTVLAGALVAYGIGRAGMALQETRSLEEARGEAPGRFLEIDGERVHVLERGTGPPLVLLHGFAGSTFDWEQHVLEPLARDHRVVAIDLWSHGFSERRASQPLDFVAFADQAVAVLDALRIDSAAVAGHSMGAAVAAVLAAEHPDRVRCVVSVAGVAPARSSEVSWFFRALLIPVLGELAMALTANLAPPQAPADYRQRMARVSRIDDTRASLLAYVRNDAKRQQLRDAYPEIRAPVLLLHGRDDRIVPLASVERIAPRITNATLIPVDGGHWLLWEAPDRVVEETAAFLAECGTPDLAPDGRSSARAPLE